MPREKTEARPTRPSASGARGAGRAHLERRHARSARSSARQRTLLADGDQRRRRLQPLERFRSDALALRHRRSIPGAASSTFAICVSDAVWAAAPQPVGGRSGAAPCRFSADRAEFHRRVSGIETVLDVTVAPEDDVELRRVTITNRSLRTRHWNSPAMPTGPGAASRRHSPSGVREDVRRDGISGRRRSDRAPPAALARRSAVWAAHVLAGACRGYSV